MLFIGPSSGNRLAEKAAVPVLRLTTDVLILGAGLAGLRAAWGALEAFPGLDVTVVSNRTGPAGASFANVHNALGIQVCHTDREREDFVREAAAIARPGILKVELARLLASESDARFQELKRLGFKFRTDADGRLMRFPGCFSPGRPRAYIFTDLAGAYAVVKAKAAALGARFIEQFQVQDLLTGAAGNECGVSGALLEHTFSRRKLMVRAGATVMALGGPAALFALNHAGPGASGWAPALLKRAGARLVNTRFLQFMWADLDGRRFWPVSRLTQKGWRIRTPDGESVPLPDHLLPLGTLRSSHAPMAYEQVDTALDHYLIEQMNGFPFMMVYDPHGNRTRLGVFAHAGNGGAAIDADGWTGVPGLFACGECAGGMHGANRLGGAMVLATQVFGRGAGRGAAAYADGAIRPPWEELEEEAQAKLDRYMENQAAWRREFSWLQKNLQRYGFHCRRPELEVFMATCAQKRQNSGDWRLCLALETALEIGNAALQSKERSLKT